MTARRLPVRSTLLLVLASTIPTSAVQPAQEASMPPASRKPAAVAAAGSTSSVTPIQPITVSLADLGYAQDVTLRGAAAGTAISFPLPTYGIESGELLLELSPSTALQDRSTVRLLINDSPAATTTVAALRQSPMWRVPLSATRKPYLMVRVESALSIGSDRCEDLQSGNLWLTIGRDSRASWTPAAGLPSIAEFFRFPGGRLLVRGKWATKQDQAESIALVATVTRIVRDLPVKVEIEKDADTSSSSATPEADASAPRPAAVRIVALATGGDATPLRREGDILYVRADAATLALLQRDNGQAAQLGRNVVMLQTAANDAKDGGAKAGDKQGIGPAERESRRQCAPDRLCLRDLGMGDQTLSGIGAMSTQVPFTIARFGGWPSRLRFVVEAAFDQIPRDTLERAVARIRLNGALLDTVDLRGTSTLHRTVDLPAPLLAVQNTMEVEFAYAPVSGHCEGTPYSFQAQLRGTSGFMWSGLDAWRGQLGEVVALDGPVSLSLDGGTPALARAAAHVLAAIARQTEDPLVVMSTSTMGASAASAGAGGAGAGKPGLRVIVGPQARSAAPVRLRLDRDLEIVSRRTSTRVFKALSDTPVVALEYLEESPRTIAIQASTGAESTLVDGAFAEALSSGRWLQVAGDTLVTNGDATLALDLAGPALSVTTDAGAPPMLPYWRWIVLLLAVVAILVFAISSYRRLGRRPPLPAAPGTV